jgi:hypothetical protein
VDVGVTAKRFGKASIFCGVLFLTLGLLQGPVSANGGGGNGNGHANAPGWTRHWGNSVHDSDDTPSAALTNGANSDCGAYCSTSDGTPSGNGNGGGNGNQPCAGCVGNADNKNPPGQASDGSDHNNGYECDGNHGVGRTNPAHSGCKPTTTTTVPQTTTTTVHETTTTTVPETTTTTVASTTSTTAAPTTTTTVAVGGSTTSTVGPDVLGVQFSRGSSEPLASTGAGFLRPFTLLGALLLLLGVALMTLRVGPLAR